MSTDDKFHRLEFFFFDFPSHLLVSFRKSLVFVVLRFCFRLSFCFGECFLFFYLNNFSITNKWSFHLALALCMCLCVCMSVFDFALNARIRSTIFVNRNRKNHIKIFVFNAPGSDALLSGLVCSPCHRSHCHRLKHKRRKQSKRRVSRVSPSSNFSTGLTTDLRKYKCFVNISYIWLRNVRWQNAQPAATIAIRHHHR